jgi:hypothetical protein
MKAAIARGQEIKTRVCKMRLANALKSLQNKVVKTKEEKMKFKQDKQKNLANTDKHEKKLIKKNAKINRHMVANDGGDFERPTSYSKKWIDNAEIIK